MAKLKVSPAGVAVYPHLQAPDEFKGARKYKVSLRLKAGEPETEEFIEQLEALRDEYAESDSFKKEFPAAKRNKMEPHPVYKEELDDEGNETGYLLFNADCQAEIEDKRTGRVIDLKPTLVDAKKKPIPSNVDIWGGSIVKVAFQPVTWGQFGQIKAYGCKMRLKAVQVIELVSGGGGGQRV